MRRQRDALAAARGFTAGAASRGRETHAVAARSAADPQGCGDVITRSSRRNRLSRPGPGRDQVQQRDGGRIDDGRYTAFKKDASAIVPVERMYTDPVKTFAYGTDACSTASRPR